MLAGRSLWRVIMGASLALACASSAPEESALAPTPASVAPPSEPSELARSLESLAAKAFEGGDLALAEDRYRRLLAVHPSSTAARLGLAAVARRRSEAEGERRWLEDALRVAPLDPDALAARSALYFEEGEGAQARRLLEQAIERRPRDAAIHAALLRQTGMASRSPAPASLTQALALANAHPYDPWAQLQAARALVAAGDEEQARLHLWRGIRNADLAPRAARAGIALLREIDPEWAEVRVVPVHSYADLGLSQQPEWKMRLRLLWARSGRTLEPLLSTVFVPVSFSTFSSLGSKDDLASIDAAWHAQTRRWPGSGLIAGFTERPMPRYGGVHRLGQAQLLGRRLIVRVEPDAEESRTLIHELLHIYGAVHVAAGVESIMNPSGESLALDPVNQGIVTLVGDRRFATGSMQRDVLRYIDAESLTKIYVDSLRLNLRLRSAGIEGAKEASRESRFIAYKKAREALALDPQLADVAILVAQLLAYQERYAQAAVYHDLVADLLGPGSPRGQQARVDARKLRRVSEALYGGSAGRPPAERPE
jgi:Tfp pilus assembly protein PilF